jgi:hypothetical protein
MAAVVFAANRGNMVPNTVTPWSEVGLPVTQPRSAPRHDVLDRKPHHMALRP